MLANLHMLQAFLLHLLCHFVHKMAALVIHYWVYEHKHHITLELSCCSRHTQLNVLLDCKQINRSATRRHTHMLIRFIANKAQTYIQTHAQHLVTSLLWKSLTLLQCRVLIDILTVPQLMKPINFPYFMVLKVSVLHPQQSATWPCPVWYANGFTGPLQWVHGHPRDPRPSGYI